jgi:hypothetical protein
MVFLTAAFSLRVSAQYVYDGKEVMEEEVVVVSLQTRMRATCTRAAYMRAARNLF